MATVRKLCLVFGLTLAALAALVFTAAFVAILWSDPTFEAPPDLSPEALAATGIDFSQPYESTPRTFRMRDGKTLAARYFAPPSSASDTTVLLVHGMLASSFTLNRAAGLLRDVAAADVVAVDLRGHGASGGHPGDVDYIGQYEDDLADVVRELRVTHPHGRIVLAGHSMGGGIALRYAEREAAAQPVDGYLLFAPYLGWGAASTRHTASPAAAAAGARFLRVHVPRVLGLSVLNACGITAFNGLRTVLFNLPPEMPLRSYSFRAMADAAPTDVSRALAAVQVPLLVAAGGRDEAFDAAAYGPLFSRHAGARVVLIPDATHEGVLRDTTALRAVHDWLEGAKAASGSEHGAPGS